MYNIKPPTWQRIDEDTFHLVPEVFNACLAVVREAQKAGIYWWAVKAYDKKEQEYYLYYSCEGLHSLYKAMELAEREYYRAVKQCLSLDLITFKEEEEC